MTRIVDNEIAEGLLRKTAPWPVLYCGIEIDEKLYRRTNGIAWTCDFISQIHDKPELPIPTMYYQVYEDETHIWVVELLFHRYDTTHDGDTESAIFVFRKPIGRIPWAEYILTRAHTIWHIYSNPNNINGRYWLNVAPGKHPITLRPFRRDIELINPKTYWEYDRIDMAGPQFMAQKSTFDSWFQKWGVDWPEQMGDHRVSCRGKYPHSPAIDPMKFIGIARRSGVRIE